MTHLESLLQKFNEACCNVWYGREDGIKYVYWMKDPEQVKVFLLSAIQDTLKMVVPEEKTKKVKNERKVWWCAKCEKQDRDVWSLNESSGYCRTDGKKLEIRDASDECYEPETDGWNSCREEMMKKIKSAGFEI